MHEKFLNKLNRYLQEKKINEKYHHILKGFYFSFKNAVKNTSTKEEEYIPYFAKLLEMICEQLKNPYQFDLYHEKITKPFNYYKFGIEFSSFFLNKQKSSIHHQDNLKKIQSYINNKENVILLSNHQSEVDPQAINAVLQDTYPKLASDIIFVAGDRVITDALAIPFSMGCNLLCIYSKKYIDIDPKTKHQKQIHNTKTMEKMCSLLKEGGKIIYVAPSGGRDRKDKNGKIQVAEFDPKSLELFYLMSKKAKTKTHFFPFALATYDMLPPPETTQIDLGEKRIANRVGVHLSFLNEVDMESIPNTLNLNKTQKREKRAEYIHNLVKQEFEKITGVN